jgi:hypothetical protein
MIKYEYGELSYNGENWQFEHSNSQVDEFEEGEITVVNFLGELGYRVLDMKNSEEFGYNIYFMERVIQE